MHTFTDARGRRWTVELSVGVAKRIRGATGVDITSDVPQLMDRLMDAITLGDVLWVCVEPQAATFDPPVTSEDFGEGLAGDAIDAATQAFLDALVDFSPSRQRAVLTPLLQRMKTEDARALAAIEKAMPEIVEKVFGAETHGETSTDSPEASE